MACSAASESDAERSQRKSSTRNRHALARSNGNAEQPCGVGTQNRVLLLLADSLGTADIFDRPLLCKRIVGSQHHVARWNLDYQEFQHVRIEQHGVVEEARQVAAEIALELRGAAVAIIVVVPPGVERQISATVGDHDF